MNPIDKIVADIREKIEKKKKRFPFWNPKRDAEGEAIRAAIAKYRASIPEQQYDLEMIASSYWGSQHILEGQANLRRAILRLAGRL